MSVRPNVLLITISGARADRLSCYGHSRKTTPGLDQIAGEGVRVAHTITSSPTTMAAHAGLFTGRFSAEHGAHEESRQLAKASWSMAETLRAAGYRTGAFCTHPALCPETGFGRGFDDFVTQRRQGRLANRAWSYGRRAGDRLLGRRDAGGRRTNESLREWLGAASEPFFAFVHYDEARFPLVTLPEMAFAGAADLARLRGLHANSEAYVLGAATLEPEDADAIGRAFDSALHYVDARIGEIVEWLASRKQLEQTLIVVTGDHGQHLGENGWVGNAAGLDECLLAVPLMLRCPGLVPQGFVVEDLSQTTDIAPTILGLLLGPEACEGMSGRMLLREGRSTTGPGFAIAERYRSETKRWRRSFPKADVRPFDVRMKAIRTRTEKFVWRSDEQNQLFDLRSDPGEQHNRLAADVARADALRRQLFDWFAEVERKHHPRVTELRVADTTGPSETAEPVAGAI